MDFVETALKTDCPDKLYIVMVELPISLKLIEKLDSAVRKLRGRGKLNEKTVAESMREIRRVLLEADVNYKELEKRFGAQGNELGELRDFFKGIEPILQNLENNPDLTKALYEGKVDASTVEAILAGKTTIDDAQKVTQANTQVKKDMGKNSVLISYCATRRNKSVILARVSLSIT